MRFISGMVKVPVVTTPATAEPLIEREHRRGEHGRQRRPALHAAGQRVGRDRRRPGPSPCVSSSVPSSEKSRMYCAATPIGRPKRPSVRRKRLRDDPAEAVAGMAVGAGHEVAEEGIGQRDHAEPDHYPADHVIPRQHQRRERGDDEQRHVGRVGDAAGADDRHVVLPQIRPRQQHCRRQHVERQPLRQPCPARATISRPAAASAKRRSSARSAP